MRLSKRKRKNLLLSFLYGWFMASKRFDEPIKNEKDKKLYDEVNKTYNELI